MKALQQLPKERQPHEIMQHEHTGPGLLNSGAPWHSRPSCCLNQYQPTSCRRNGARQSGKPKKESPTSLAKVNPSHIFRQHHC